MDQKAIAFARHWAKRYVRTKHPHGLDAEDVENRILESLYKYSRGNLSHPKRWDDFAPSQSQTLFQVNRELDFKSIAHFASSQWCTSLQGNCSLHLKSNQRFTSSENYDSLKVKRRRRFRPLLLLEFTHFLSAEMYRIPENKG